MARLFYHTMQDNAGNLLFDVSGTMRIAGTGTIATIYGDEALTVILPNPMTNHPSYGSFKCFLGAGDYDFYMAKSGYTFETLTGVQGHGTMAQQDAGAVAITGGSAVLGTLAVGAAATPGFVLVAGLGKSVFQAGALVGIQTDPVYPFDAAGDMRLLGHIGVGDIPRSNERLTLTWPKDTLYGLTFNPLVSDAGPGACVLFRSVGGGVVGSIDTTGSTTAYNTSSDARLKTAVQNLVGELAVIRALRPVRFRWRADDSEGVGFLASEVQEHVQGVVTGEPDAVDEAGGILPQQIDHSKFVPWLVGAVQALAGQVETLTERVAELEAGLGV